MPIYDYDCKACVNKFEKLVKVNHTDTIICPECDSDNVVRMITGTSFKLDGTDPGYPTAYARWANDHVKRAKNGS